MTTNYEFDYRKVSSSWVSVNIALADIENQTTVDERRTKRNNNNNWNAFRVKHSFCSIVEHKNTTDNDKTIRKKKETISNYHHVFRCLFWPNMDLLHRSWRAKVFVISIVYVQRFRDDRQIVWPIRIWINARRHRNRKKKSFIFYRNIVEHVCARLFDSIDLLSSADVNSI